MGKHHVARVSPLAPPRARSLQAGGGLSDVARATQPGGALQYLSSSELIELIESYNDVIDEVTPTASTRDVSGLVMQRDDVVRELTGLRALRNMSEFGSRKRVSLKSESTQSPDPGDAAGPGR